MMIVRAINGSGHGHAPERGRLYIVYACAFNIYSPGSRHPRQGSLQYYIEAQLEGRSKPTALIFDDAKNFEIVEDSIPQDWQSVDFDMKRIYSNVANKNAEQGNRDAAQRLRDAARYSQGEIPRITLVSFPEMLDFDFYVAVHDDSMEDSHYAVFDRYKRKYEKLYSGCL